MKKKEYILSVLEIFPDWEMWWWIKAMVQNDQLDDHTMNLLVIAFKRAMDNLSDIIEKHKMVETIQEVENLKKKKKEQAKKDAESLEELDSKLNDF